MAYNLFLDDIRLPKDAYQYTYQDMFINKTWHIVRNYNEFVNFIERNGLPELISFDHDLAIEHYTPEPLWDSYEESKRWADNQNYTEKTGYDCAKWLVEYCIKHKLKCPKFYVHSMNPIGKDNIMFLLNSFNKHH